MLMDKVPLLNVTLASLDARNEAVFVGGNETRVGVGELTPSVGLIWNNTDVDGGGNLTDEEGEVWWKGTSGGGDFPKVKFGPDLSFLEPFAAYISLLVVVVAIVLAIGVVCRCVTGKVLLSLGARRGPEIALQLGSGGDVVERVVAVESDWSRRDGDGFGRNAPRDPRGYEV